METTQKIVKAYCRYIMGWATIPNIKCPGQSEIDLLAINPVTNERYHIESDVSISSGFSKLTAKPYREEDQKKRAKAAGQRRTIGFFIQKKFSSAGVLEKLQEYGFREGEYIKVIVTWGWQQAAKKEADKHNIELWDFRNLMKEIAHKCQHDRTYFTDDTMRTLQLFAPASRE